MAGWTGEVFAEQRSGSANVLPPAAGTVIRVARSGDGLAFVDTGDVFLKHASAPDVVVLANGDLLAVFDYADVGDPEGATFLALSRSSDGGRTWSPARRIRFTGTKGRATDARHGDLVRMPDGRLRLYFVSSIERRRAAKRSRLRNLAVVRAAERRDGFNFRVDPRVRVPVAGSGDVHPMPVWVDRRLHLYVAGIGGRASKSAREMTRVRHLVSQDGCEFSRFHSTYVPNATFVGSLALADNGLRAYVSSSDGVISLLSKDGRRWNQEEGVRVPAGWDSAVVRLTDDSYLMLYCTTRDAECLASTAIVEAPVSGEPDEGSSTDGHTEAESDATTLADDEMGELAEAEANAEADTGAPDSTDQAVGQPGHADVGTADPQTDAGLRADALDQADAELQPRGDVIEFDELFEYWDPVTSDGYAPTPDFVHKIDYFEWYCQYALGHPDDNAYYAYMEVLPQPWNKEAWKQFKSQFNNMYYGDDTGSPGPWDPSEHPEWEASSIRTQGLLEGFREASLHEGYASPPILGNTEESGILDGEELLYSIKLPPLAAHLALGKATLADAWRVGEDGNVSPERMLDAWETTLRAANHIEQGATIIEDIVSLAERKLVEQNARWALEHDVFSADELETALDTLQEYDRIEKGFETTLRGEHAFSMDIAQYLFSPPTADGQAQVNMKRTRAAFDFSEGIFNDFARMGPGDAYATIDAIDRHSRNMDDLMGIGYPEVRAADIRAAWEEERDTSPVTEYLMPSLDGYYQMKAQIEASRRATQLAYATHLHKARSGSWPQTLDELSTDYGSDVRIDPFTGDRFGYRVTDEGPTIYSFSEDGLDSGGVHSSSWGEESDNDANSDDYVFWPPQPRK